jgi:hypothetical protein
MSAVRCQSVEGQAWAETVLQVLGKDLRKLGLSKPSYEQAFHCAEAGEPLLIMLETVLGSAQMRFISATSRCFST